MGNFSFHQDTAGKTRAIFLVIQDSHRLLYPYVRKIASETPCINWYESRIASRIPVCRVIHDGINCFFYFVRITSEHHAPLNELRSCLQPLTRPIREVWRKPKSSIPIFYFSFFKWYAKYTIQKEWSYNYKLMNN